MFLNALHVIQGISVLVEDLLLMGSAMQAGFVHVELRHLCLKLVMVLTAVEAYAILDFIALSEVADLYLALRACFVASMASLSLLVCA